MCVHVTEHLETAEHICQSFDFIQDTGQDKCQAYFDGFWAWLKPPTDAGEGTMFYQPNVILGMHTQTIVCVTLATRT